MLDYSSISYQKISVLLEGRRYSHFYRHARRSASREKQTASRERRRRIKRSQGEIVVGWAEGALAVGVDLRTRRCVDLLVRRNRRIAKS